MAGQHCPKCQGRMAEGFVIDNTYGTRGVAGWVIGPPEYSMWTGVKLRGRKPVPIRTFRCERCNYLESYAPPT